MPLIAFDTKDGQVAINPRHVVKLRETRLNKQEVDALPLYETTITLVGGTKEVVKGSQRDVARQLGVGV